LTRPPFLSVVVVVYNIAREAPRTLYSLSAEYQRHIAAEDYEVIVVDNGSDVPLDPSLLAGLTGNFRLIRIDPARPSPAQAINQGIAAARGEVIGMMIDGARIATPGLLHFARHGAGLYDTAAVATLGWYVGHDLQGWGALAGYDQAREDELLASVDWTRDGYRLFEIGTMDESSVDGWFQAISESNALFLRREVWEALGGVDERFELPGGGLVDLDTFRRVLELPDAELVILLGEATFHQWHSGTATGARPDQRRANWYRSSSEYSAIRGYAYERMWPRRAPTYIGTLTQAALARMVRAAMKPVHRHAVPPLGADFDEELWMTRPARFPDETTARLVDLARAEFRNGRFEASCAVARLIHARVPHGSGIEATLALVAPTIALPEDPPESERADYHLALAEAHQRLGEVEPATMNYRAALTFNSDLPLAHLGLATLRMPGDGYLVWLERLYRALVPESAIEIGVFQGASLALFRPPTLVIGVDPNATVLSPLSTETHIFAETSDQFFEQHRAERLLGGRSLSIGFIDGLHLFEQALKDFIGLEALCGDRSVIILHDTVPLDKPTQARTRETVFHSGDVWKTVLLLKQYRPDLDVFTIATPPTGLTVVAGLDPASRVLAARYGEAVATMLEMPFESIEGRMDTMLNLVPNDWTAVRARLEKHGII